MADPTQVRAPDFGLGIEAYGQSVSNRSRLAEMAARDEERQYQRDQRSNLVDIGSQAAAGNLAGARDTAYRAGNLDVGLKLDATRAQTEAKDLNDIAGAITSADTPEKFTAALSGIEQRKGLQPGSLTGKYQFAHRDSILGEVLGAKEQAELAIKKLNVGNKELPPGYRATPGGGMDIIPNGPADLAAAAEQRRKAVIAQGADPKSPEMQAYIVSGKMPREDQKPLTATDKKFIDEADDAVLSTKEVITALTAAKKISPAANSGWGASGRAALANNLPDWMVPDRVSSPDSAAATKQYENLVLGQALAQLKSIFGAAPTEGERKILLDLQASVSLPDAQRQAILDRAVQVAQRRLEYNEQKAAALRGQTYYKPGWNGAPQAAPAAGGPPAAPAGIPAAPASPAPANPAPAAPQRTGSLPPGVTADQALTEARAAIAAKKDRNTVIARLQSWGVDTAGL